jgi:hypothetical protein
MNALVTVPKAALILGSTTSHVMHLCHTAQLPSGELGGTMVIPTSSVHQYAKRLRVDIRRDSAEVSGA